MNVSVLGGSGFAAGELLRILLRHQHVSIRMVASRGHAGEFLHSVHPHLRGVTQLAFSENDIEKVVAGSDFVFSALPFKASLEAVPRLVEAGVSVVDLSAAYRLPLASDYEAHYGGTHPQPDLLKRFVYGLPEVNRSNIKEAKFVANPGCTAIAAILALNPFLEDLDERDYVIVDAKVGSSGSGSKPGPQNMHAVRYGVVRPYSLGWHRHSSEVLSFARNRGKDGLKTLFSSHGVNMARGILTTLYLTLSMTMTTKEVWQHFRKAYSGEPFIRLIKDKSGAFRAPDPKLDVGSNFCDLGFELQPDGRHLVVVAALDNLVKGAAGNAVQCMNLMESLPEAEGLNLIPVYPV
jgi:N-acetyl-gamma-glutamyl-phosphate/LysW-gamma-L-alpha-aminoadipyl-6-phosphate reductase